MSRKLKETSAVPVEPPPARDSGVCNSPTLAPPFDLEEFAKEQMDRAPERRAPSSMPTSPPGFEPMSGRRPAGSVPQSEFPSEIPTAQAPIDDAVRAGRGNPGPPSSGHSSREAIWDELQKKFFAGEYSGALVLAEQLQANDPQDSAAEDFAEECRRMLAKSYATRLGSLDKIPILAVSKDELKSLAIDHVGGFLLSLVDGNSSIDNILDMCGMPRLDALRLIFDLVQQGTIALK